MKETATKSEESDPEPARPPHNDFPIVGVGASAGGLEALKQLLGALPGDTGMAYVLVQHLDPRHESMMADLLAKGSRMPVSEVREDTAVAPNHVYVAPGKHDVAMGSGMLKLVPRTSTRGQHMPIDSFLRTLAVAQGTKAIGVILSGTASDGTLGLKAIKAEGGIAFAQDPESASYDGMPRSAIASGCVDFILPPAKIARELSRLSRHPYANTPPLHTLADEPSAPKRTGGLKAILALLRKSTGTDFSLYKEATIKRRIARRMALVRAEKLEDYVGHLERHPDEVYSLFQDCLITVTSFFREPETFEILCDQVLPTLLKDRPPEAPLRVWVPACATGEEAYSIVICLLEHAGGLTGGSPAFQVFATDLNEAALGKARAGSYPESIAKDVSPKRLARFFSRVNGRYQASKALRDMCVFAHHDLTRDPPFSRLDLISCRNVLIYLQPHLQQRVLATFHYALKPSGFLLLGASEATGRASDLFAPMDRKHRIYSKRPIFAPTALGLARGRPVESVTPGGGTGKTAPSEAPSREADRLLLARYAPAGVIVDGKDAILEFRGQVDPYLEHTPGRASLDLFKMARKGLLLGLRQAIQEGRKKDAPLRKEGLRLLHGGQLHRFDLEVIPLKGSGENEGSLLVLFDGHPETRKGRGGPAPRRAAAPVDPSENAKLRQEVAEATRFLQTVMREHEAASEEAQASNEEILSANEELQSVNEELETAKEEMESSNEELATLNQEVRERNLDLGRALDLANGIVETVRNPLLLLDANLRVERANQAFLDHFGVPAEECVGRRLYELGNGQWDIPALREALETVHSNDGRLDDFEVEHEFPHIGRRSLVLNARKIRHDTEQGSIVLAFEDRTELKRAGRERNAVLAVEQDARKRAEHADRIKDEFVATLSHELRGPLNAMVGWVHVLRETGIDDATRERGRAAIERGVNAQARLIEELLDYSRTVTGKLSLSQRLMDVVPVAQAAVDAIRSATEAKQISLNLMREPGPAIVLGDPDRLQQVLWNLLSNAVKFTPRQGRVEIRIGRVGTNLQIRVSDNGQGISADFLPHVFERFRQQEGASNRTQGGLGLGLSIVKQLVELHGGTVEAESSGQQGTTMTVSLPIPPLLLERKGATDSESAQEPTPSEKAWSETDRTALNGLRVLVVEDDPDSREMLVTAFAHCGAQVSAAASAREAMEAFRRAVPDVLISDIGLPGQDGYELMARIRALPATQGGQVPALALTAYSGPEDRRKALAAGFQMHVAKPAEPAALVARVAALAARGGAGK